MTTFFTDSVGFEGASTFIPFASASIFLNFVASSWKCFLVTWSPLLMRLSLFSVILAASFASLRKLLILMKDTYGWVANHCSNFVISSSNIRTWMTFGVTQQIFLMAPSRLLQYFTYLLKATVSYTKHTVLEFCGWAYHAKLVRSQLGIFQHIA